MDALIFLLFLLAVAVVFLGISGEWKRVRDWIRRVRRK